MFVLIHHLSLISIMDPNDLECLRRGNPVVFFDISIGGSPSGRIKLELFKNKCPKVGRISEMIP